MLFVLGSMLLSGRALKSETLPTLTSCAQVRKLTAKEANRGYPVRLRAVVTYFDPDSQPEFFVQDASGGIWIRWTSKLPTPVAGDLIELRGISTQLDFAPDVLNPNWKIIGRAPMPQPKHVSFMQMASTLEDARRVEIEGVIRHVEFENTAPAGKLLALGLSMPDGKVEVQMPWDGSPVPSDLVDALVRIQGVCGAAFSTKNQLVRVFLYVSSLKDVSVLQKPSADPFAAATMSIDNLQRFGFQTDLGHRVKVAGIVTATINDRGLYRR